MLYDPVGHCKLSSRSLLGSLVRDPDGLARTDPQAADICDNVAQRNIVDMVDGVSCVVTDLDIS